MPIDQEYIEEPVTAVPDTEVQATPSEDEVVEETLAYEVMLLQTSYY
ncbi:hypothetical protein JIG36_04370 [Actinoplanes sp. LDG1-06]|uniref:Uncharacterized protein n=1 Tax=Paractinoplanes ovalisporus TaxID=2810368 RepID=A0ABS2A4K9_9ACTN|nr:hypothetical protein [Actinoplanes ovalisporus]MBM2614790.1 hypothetical protein [Actinoplanes ovalisporus]